MNRATPSSSPSSPYLGRERTAAASTLDEPLTPQRYCSMDDVMLRAPGVDAPPPVARARVYTYYENLLCETCGSGDHGDDLLLCDRCDRGHHTFCLRPIAVNVPVGPWFCPVCAPLASAKAPKSFPLNQTKIFDFFGIQKDEQDAGQAAKCRLSQEPRYYEDLLCETCGSGDRDDDLLLCDHCDRGHHTFCLRPIAVKVPVGPWFCPVCTLPASAKAPKSFPVNQTKIFDFFGIQKDEQDAGHAAKFRLSQALPANIPL